MTVEIRRDKEIYGTDGGWFQARWHFSFDHYHDPRQMGVGALRVFNDDRLQPGAVWPMHPHADIESCTYVVEGLFAHEDSLGNDGRLEPGAAQVMRFSSAGALHSERNGSQSPGRPGAGGPAGRGRTGTSRVRRGPGRLPVRAGGRAAAREESLGGGDAAKLAGPEELELTGVDGAELILIEVPLQFRPIGVWAGLT